MKKVYSKRIGTEVFALAPEQLVTEPWVKNQICFRCFGPGRCRGYIVGIERLVPYIPAWCPKLINNEEVLENG